MQGNPCYARLFADLTRTPQGAFSCPFGTIHLVSPNPIKASGGQSRAPPVAGEARRKPSEQGSARKAPRADAARPLRTALRPPSPQGFLDKLGARRQVCRRALCFAMRCPKRAFRTRGAKRPRLKGDTAQKHRTKGENKMPRLSHVMERRSQGGKIWTALAHGPQGTQKSGTSYGPSSCRMGAGPLGKAGVKPAAGLG